MRLMAETHEHHHTEAGHKGAEAHVEKPASRTGSEEAVGCWRSIAGLMSGQGGSGGTPLGWVGTGKRYSKKQRVVLKVVMHHMVFTALAMQCIGHDKKKWSCWLRWAFFYPMIAVPRHGPGPSMG